MAKLIFGMNVSLDGYVDHDKFAPDQTLFRHFIDQANGLTGSIYGRKLYELMRYWDNDDPAWMPDLKAFAAAWRKQKKWVVSCTLKSVGPNAALIEGEVEAAIRAIKAEQPGEIELGGPALAGSLAQSGLIDEYLLYLHPAVLGAGTPFFQRTHPKLRLAGHDQIGENAMRLSYVPA